MKACLAAALVGLAISFALPTYAQQKDVADPQTTQKILAMAKTGNDAHNNNDAAPIAEQFTRDGVFVTTEGPITGRQAIQNWYTDLFQWWHPKNHIDKLDGNVVHLIGTAVNELWVTGEYSETGQGKNGEPIPIKGYWSAIYVRETDDWKVRMAAMNTTEDSVLLINKSFAPQPAATPSPTARPPLVGLAISLASPTYAQQKDVADPQTTQKINTILRAYAEAENNNDGAAVAALFTRDAVFVAPEGPIIGRQAIQKWYTNLYQWWHPKNSIHKVDGNAVHLIGLASNELWATGEWSRIGQSKNGEPLPIKGYWARIYVREGDDWKIRMSAWNFATDSVLLVHQSFSPAPAGAPSSTASPSNQ
jgi:uncharacterized protein (TIGR02246 family)